MYFYHECGNTPCEKKGSESPAESVAIKPPSPCTLYPLCPNHKARCTWAAPTPLWQMSPNSCGGSRGRAPALVARSSRANAKVKFRCRSSPHRWGPHRGPECPGEAAPSITLQGTQQDFSCLHDLSSFILFQHFMDIIMSSTNKNIFISSFLILMPFISFSFLISLARTSSTMLSKSYNSKCPWLVLSLS